jgi:oxygen-independent coproporphyrinogen-3 oxidase
VNSEQLLIKKYNVPGPRYTSYPTVPFWKNSTLSLEEWTDTLFENYRSFNSKEISIYIHLPFCEQLCTFCGCHKRITKNHSYEEPYIESLKKEWDLYREILLFEPIIRELHFGGGTPTFFSTGNLIELLQHVFNQSSVDPSQHELSFEAHPIFMKLEHSEKLFDFGFRRLSMGIQDYDESVQTAIHRFQPFENVKIIHDHARKLGYESISHDLVYGLPKQQLSGFEVTIEKTIDLYPDRIALYGYAHVPWIKGNGQRGFDDIDIPRDKIKRELYEMAHEKLISAGYVSIGMDHFALPNDSMTLALKNKKLHRNFMGYTTQNTKTLIGLGMSSISDSWFGFAQNEKNLEDYQKQVNQGLIPITKGHLLSREDLEIRNYILDLMCHFEMKWVSDASELMKSEVKNRLQELISDELIIETETGYRLTEKGLPFVRNACMAFDTYLHQANRSVKPLFSQTI